jgi:dUTP pyrophosphatase
MVPKLKIFILNNDLALKEEYQKQIKIHNDKITNTKYPDSGFDILQPKQHYLGVDIQKYSNKLKLGIVAAAFSSDFRFPLPYYLYVRSSTGKTPMRLSNQVGIIDTGYRGELMAMVDLHDNFVINENDKFFQICMGDLQPFLVELVDNLEDLGITERGSGGFGSTNV